VLQIDWRNLVLQKLEAIDAKLDTKVDKEMCNFKCSRISIKYWAIIVIIIATVIGSFITGTLGLLTIP